MTNFYFNRRKIKKIINEINPYIIHLHGTENAYFVSSFLDLYQKFPSLITIQGFINLQIGKKPTRVQKQRAVIEKKILQIGTNFGIRTYDMEKFILQYNKSANLFWHEYFINYLHNHVDENLNENVKKFDIIFFAKLTKLKGIEDLILTVAKLKPIFPELKVAIIGGAKSDYLSFLKKLVTENNCEDNIQFYGKLSTQEEVFKILRKAKVSVLPTYVDVIPGTIIESMFHRTAVVSYKTGGLPEINAEQENILLVDIGDINELCNKVKSLLLNEQFRKEMEEKAYRYAKRRWNNEKSFNDIVSIYRKILEWRN
jgi:glycosyltransferase involved in cell wall biosynthesis